MKPTPEETAALAKRIAEAEAGLQNLEREIERIGQPAAHELQHRIESLKIEERALRRNAGIACAQSLGTDDPEAARDFAHQIGYPLIVKPRDAAGAVLPEP